MAVDVTIEASGLALCFLKPKSAGSEDVWNIAFLCDEQHLLDFKINGHTQLDWRPKGRDFYLFVDHKDHRPTRGNLRKLLNLSDDDYAHGTNATGKANLSIDRKNKKKKGIDLVWMQVPNSKVEILDGEDTKIMQTNPIFRPPKRVADRGKRVRLTFQVNEDFDLVATDYESGGAIFPPIKISAGSGNILLTFDNDCHGTCDYNDFVQLYDLVTHMDGGKEVRFVTWAEDAETEMFVFSAEPSEREEQNKRIDELRRAGWIVKERKGGVELIHPRFGERLGDITTAYGNCDPVGSEPPPGP